MATRRHHSRGLPGRPCGTRAVVRPAGRSTDRWLPSCEPGKAVDLSTCRSTLAQLRRQGQAIPVGDGRQVMMALETHRGRICISLGKGAVVSLTARNVMLGIGGCVIPLFGKGPVREGPTVEAGRLECLACLDGLSVSMLVNALGDRFQIEVANIRRASGEKEVSNVVIARLSEQQTPMEQLQVCGLDCGKVSVHRRVAGALTAAGALYGIGYTFERKLLGR